MYDHLYEYLILFRQVNMPGIGNFVLERKPAQTDFTQKVIKPAAYSISLQPSTDIPSKKFFQWLSDKLGVAYHEAIVKFNGFVLEIKSSVIEGNKVKWPEVGVLSKGMSGEIKLEPSLTHHEFDRPVNAVRVIRDKAVHQVRVGEDEKTSEEMTELLNPESVKRTYWKYAGIVLLIIALLVLLFYFLQNGFSTDSAANQQKLVPKEKAVTHRAIQ